MPRTHQTKQAYVRRANKLFLRFKRDTGRHIAADTDAFLVWLTSIRDGVTASTWRQYRASVAFSLDARGLTRLADRVRNIDTSGCHRSTTPADGIDPEQRAIDLQAIDAALADSRSGYAKYVRLILEATRLTGLQPTEWRSVRMDATRDGTDTLIVTNARGGSAHSRDASRTLLLCNVTGEEFFVIYNMCTVARRQARDDNWDAFYFQCRKLMYRTARRLWPQRDHRPTLYSARHQFVVEARQAGLPETEIAALLGRRMAEMADGTRHSGAVFRVLAS